MMQSVIVRQMSVEFDFFIIDLANHCHHLPFNFTSKHVRRGISMHAQQDTAHFNLPAIQLEKLTVQYRILELHSSGPLQNSVTRKI